MMITAREINNAKQELHDATVYYHNCSIDLANAKSGLEVAKSQGILDGSIEGKNAELREASARQLLSKIYAEVEDEQSLYDEAKLRLDLARIEDDRCKMMLRFAELAVI